MKERLGHYRMLEPLGKGGMGEVYVAEDEKLGRQVALKILPPEMAADADRLTRFEQEARTVASLNHPNIVTLHSIEEDDGVRFLTMELIRGRRLSELIPRDGMPLPRLLELAVPTVDAVAAAHLRGITHRDLKPDNVVVSDDGVPKVLDFGLAKLTEPAADSSETQAATLVQTAEGKVYGTIAYMSPEQAQGKPVDHRSDVFSLGILLYEMATGVRPFTGDTGASILASILKDEPAALTGSGGRMPRPLARIVRICLAKDPLRRYQTAIDLRNELEELRRESASGELDAVSPPPVGGRRSGTLVIAGLIAVGLIGALTLYLLLRWRGAPPPGAVPFKATFQAVTDFPGAELFPSLSPDGKFVAYESRTGAGRDIQLLRIGGRNPINLTADFPGDDEQPAFSPDGERIAFRSARDGGGLFVMGATGESVRRLTDFGFHPAWSPDGARIVFCTESVPDPRSRNRSSNLWTVDVATGAIGQIDVKDAVHPSFSPDGGRIAYGGVHAGGQRDLWTIPSSGGEPVPVTDDQALDWNPVWSADGHYLYFSSDRGGSMSLWRIPIDERTGETLGEPEAVTTGSGGENGFLTVSRNGGRIGYVVLAKTQDVLRLGFDPASGDVLGEPEPIPGLSRSFASAAASPDGKLLALTNFLATQEDIFVVNADGTGLRQLTNDPFKDRQPKWLPDGQRLVFYSDRGGSYDIWSIRADGSDLHQVTAVPDHDLIWQVVSPDGGRLIAQDTFTHQAWIVQMDDSAAEQHLEELEGLQVEDGWFSPWSWSPEGDLLAGIFLHAEGTSSSIATYSLTTHEIRRWTDSGMNPVWLEDGRRILFSDGPAIDILDTASGERHEVGSLKSGEITVGSMYLAPGGHTVYAARTVIEADVWLMEVAR